ncbi:peptidoglycan DD-metalloendopeptidase family protein [Methyloprofundus sp.]|uniref:peptidoglycan DD-metalloendopeptidase family protein n=1 Tax=Methyloprofundus sp. TaxID=2020875 RepID=UPI003D0FDB6B
MNKILLTLLLIPQIALSSALPQQLAAPGGIVNIQLGSVETPAPVVTFQDKRVLIVENDHKWYAIVGIPLKIKAGQHSIQVTSGATSTQLDFAIVDKDYPAQYITIKNKRMVNPNPDDLKRITSERPAINKALNTWTEQPVGDLLFSIPVEGRLSSPFGLKRFFNNQPKNPHSGLDIAAPKGTTISAPAPGLVINTGGYYYNGNTVFLDHGQGLVTGYFHMSKITVKAGQIVEQGTKLGEVGETGRVTGPHLHWNVYLNKTKVDPALFVPELSATKTEAEAAQ